MNYIHKSPSIAFNRVNFITTRHEYQKDAGNLNHIHLVLEILGRSLNESENNFSNIWFDHQLQI